MNLGDSFVSGDDPTVDCIIVWTGGVGLSTYIGMSSLMEGARQQPAKGVSGRGRPTPAGASQGRTRT